MALRSLNLLYGLALLGALTGCTSTEDKETDEPPVGDEICDNAEDDDDDGDVDCDDADCDADPACAELPATESDCDDGADEDGDGDTDCDDSDCADDPACDEAPTTETDCDDGVDEDADGATDCDDSDCAADPACAEPATETLCADGLDDDADGAVDCDDTDCVADPACAAPAVEALCADGVDDDGDGAVDCDDTDCAADAACVAPATETLCDDALDDDGDGAVDCDDTDCATDAACAAPATETVCDDTLDDDADGAVDCDDTDCAGDIACAEPAVEASCADGIDDDGDGLIDCDDGDCAADAACALPTVETACGDGVDDDGDGAIDCEDDDCAAYSDCAIPTVETACSDGIDEDGDGAADCADADCASDDACIPDITVETACSDGVDEDGDGATDCDDTDCSADAACAVADTCADSDLGSAIGYGLAMGTTTGAGDDYARSCGSSSYSPEDASHAWTAPADGTYTVTTDGSSYDTVLTVWSGDCSTESDCDDDGGSGTQSLITFTAVAGEEVVFVVDGYSSTGDYVLSVYTDAETDCRDGVDEDGDGGADCADSECAADATCLPEATCDDGTDEDLDGATDCEDTDCAEDLACTHACADDDLGSIVGEAVASGSTVGGTDDYLSTCAYYTTPEVSWLWTAPADGTYTFDTVGSDYDTMLSIEQGDCSGAELDCNDDTDGLWSEVSLSLYAGDQVVVHVEGYSDAGNYILNVWTGSEVACDDGGDEDLDGAVDCDDSDCSSTPACLVETVCDDGLDEEGDGATDCLDSQCAEDAVCDTSLADYDLGSATGTVVATGTTVGAGDDLTPSCGYSAAEDVAYSWVAPYAGSWTFDLSGTAHDTIIGLYAADGTSLGCDDDSGTGTASLEVVTLDAGQLVIIGVDGYSTRSGAYTLAIY